MVGALALSSAAITTLMSISLLWTISGEGIAVLVSSVVALLAGMIIPLPLFPGLGAAAAARSAVRGMMDLPARVYTGDIPPPRPAWVLLHQAGLDGGPGRAGPLALRARATRRLVVQGG